MTIYTIRDGETVARNLTAEEAAAWLLNDDGADYEIRAGEECSGVLAGERFWELWTRKQVANRPWGRTVIHAIAPDEETGTTKIMDEVLRSGHWERDELSCFTNQGYDEMVAELAADEQEG